MVLQDLLLTSKLDDQPRFKQMVEETKSGLESSECVRNDTASCAEPVWGARNMSSR